jgi:acetyl esterase/lipase
MPYDVSRGVRYAAAGAGVVLVANEVATSNSAMQFDRIFVAGIGAGAGLATDLVVQLLLS